MGWLGFEPLGCHLDQNRLSVHSHDQVTDLKSELSISCAVTHLYHVDDMVWQPEQAKHNHDSQDEFLAADLSAESGLLQAF